MIIDMFTPTMGLECLLLLIIAGLLAALFNNWAQTRAERFRKWQRQQRITNFLETAENATKAIQELKGLIPAEDMRAILDEATAKELKQMRNAIAEIETAAAALKPALTAQIEATLTDVGLLTAKNANQKGNDQNGQQNGGNDGKKLIGELLGRLKAAGKDLDFNKLLKLLKDAHGINNAAEFAALPEDKRIEIEATLKA